MSTVTILTALTLVGCKQPEQVIKKLSPEIAVSPQALAFGGVVVDFDGPQALEIINSGKDDLEVQSVSIEGATRADAFFVEDEVPVLEPDGVFDLPVHFLPTTYEDYTATLVLTTNDADDAEVRVPMSGTGIYAPTPDIQVSPAVLDFGTVAPGSSGLLYFEVDNVGDADLHIGSTVQEGSGAFVIQGDPDNSTLAANNGHTTVLVSYNPTVGTGDWSNFTISSDDPDEADTLVTLIGNGGGDYQYPVAILHGPTEAEPVTTISFDGSDSYDPNGLEPLTYEWTLTRKPTGSQTDFTGLYDVDPSLFLDLAGDYTAQLVVTNTNGVRSAPAELDIKVRPNDKMHVELTWNTNNSDIDLHLINDPGWPIYDTPYDCCYCNETPNWGDGGESSDDPSLDQDNQVGLGPENISIDQPADGDYEIKVNYFRDHGGGNTTATVNVYLNGELAATGSQLLTDEDQNWTFGVIHWPDALVSQYSGEVAPTDDRQCYSD